ncbi:MAG: hypothetical protein JXN64_10485 [Spirochaetes bacterium]|nr:hypothetical protein [Spirochaetota bacterium]
MFNECQSFLKILLIELDDLEQDIQMLIKHYKEDHDADKLTNYVFLQNVALMQGELFGVESFHEEISNLDASSYTNLQALIDDLNAKIKMRIERQGIPNSFLVAMNRKIEKVRRYIKHEK